jgi:FixJ family two-component response regulator
LPTLAERVKAAVMSASSDRAELSTLRSQLEELARRVEAVADRYADTADSQIASDLYAAERTMISARRAVDKAIAALDDLARS